MVTDQWWEQRQRDKHDENCNWTERDGTVPSLIVMKIFVLVQPLKSRSSPMLRLILGKSYCSLRRVSPSYLYAALTLSFLHLLPRIVSHMTFTCVSGSAASQSSVVLAAACIWNKISECLCCCCHPAPVNPLQLFPVRCFTGYQAIEDIIQAAIHPISGWMIFTIHNVWILSACREFRSGYIHVCRSD